MSSPETSVFLNFPPLNEVLLQQQTNPFYPLLLKLKELPSGFMFADSESPELNFLRIKTRRVGYRVVCSSDFERDSLIPVIWISTYAGLPCGRSMMQLPLMYESGDMQVVPLAQPGDFVKVPLLLGCELVVGSMPGIEGAPTNYRYVY